jgi:hypothetical protein
METTEKAPALVKRLTVALMELGHPLVEAQAMVANDGTRAVAAYVQERIGTEAASAATAKVSQTKGEDNMALKCEIGNDGKYKSIELIETGNGIQSAKPLPQAKAAPTKVEPAKVEPLVQQPQAEVMYKFSSLPASMQALIEQITIYGMPLALPVCDVVGFTGEGGNYRPVLKVRSGQEAIDAYNWLLLTDARNWQNLPMLVVFPTDEDNLRRARSYYSRPDHRPSQAVYALTCCGVVRTLNSYDFSKHTVVVPPPEADKQVADKVKAKARRADAEAAKVEPAKVEQEPAKVTEAILQELATATNHMKKVSLVNKVLVALGEPKVASKITKVELQPTVERLLKTMGIVVEAVEPKAKAKAKAKATVEPKPKAHTKREIEKFYIQLTGCSTADAKKMFKGVDVKWTSSIERAAYAASIGM